MRLDASNRALNFGYDASSRIVKLTDPSGGVYLYKFDEATSVVLSGKPLGNNLTSITYPDGHTRIYSYNEQALTSNTNFAHALTGISDENGIRYANYSYDAKGRAYDETHAPQKLGGPVDHYNFVYNVDTSGNPTTTVVTDPLGTARTYHFTTVLGVVKSTGTDQPGGSGCGPASSNITYDTNGNVKTRTDFNTPPSITAYTYEMTRNLEITRIEAQGKAEQRAIETDWHTRFRLPTETREKDANGNLKRVTDYIYDGDNLSTIGVGNLTTKTIKDFANAKARSWTYTYTTAADNTLPNLLKSIDGPRTNVADITTYAYYPNGDLQTISNALGHITSITQYDPNGRPQSITDPNGLITSLTYWPRGWLKSQTVGTEITRYDYDGVGQIIQVTRPDASTARYTYDAAHRLTDISDSLNNRIQYTLDAIGNRTKEEIFNAAGSLLATHSRSFDALNRLYQDIGAYNQTTTYGYDANGNLKTEVGPRSDVTNTSARNYDALNRLIKVTAGDNSTTQYAYDPLDQLKTVTDPNNYPTQYTSNALGDTTQIQSPDSGATTRTFDEAGNLTSETDTRGITTSWGITIGYGYDSLNRLTSVRGRGSDFIYYLASYSYDYGTNGVGRLSNMNNRSGRTQWSYDAQGRVASKQSSVSSKMFTLGYTYDTAGHLTQISYPSGKLVGYTYTLDKVSGITVNGQPLLSNIQYQPFGPAKAWSWGNGTSYARTFDQDGRVSSYPLASSVNTLIYDPAGNITRFIGSDPAYNQGFGYDVVDRLTSFVANNTNQSYAYDSNGNRTNILVGAMQYPYTYAANSNQLLQAAGPAARTYTYDAAGHIVGDGVNTFDYNELGRLSKASRGTTTTYYYLNGLGQRVLKSSAAIPSGAVEFVYDESGHLVGEYDNTGAAIEETVYLGDMPVAVLRGSNVYYAYTDHLNTVRVIVDSVNKIVWRWDSDPFGSRPPNENPSGLGVFNYNLRLPGQYWDQETGLHYNYYRSTYDPATGRYEEVDPIGLRGGINPYSYVGGNPLSFVDPSGLATLVITSGWNGGYNIFGHDALAFTNAGVYSYGTKNPYGSSLTNYLQEQLLSRNISITVLNTSPEQERTMVDYYNSNYGLGAKYHAQSNNCANAAAGALSAAGVLGSLPITDLMIPYDVQRWTSRLPGATTQTLTKGSAVPSGFASFNQ